MRHFMSGFLVMVMALPAASADDTVKCDEQVFSELESAAGAGAARLDLGARRVGAAAPVVEEEAELEIELRPLPAKVVQAVVAKKVGEVQHCYEKATRKVKNAASEVSLRFVITPKGTTSQIQVVVDGTRGRGLEKCIVASVRKWKFTANEIETPVDIPFVFADGGSAL